jgi:hypothetical protein
MMLISKIITWWLTPKKHRESWIPMDQQLTSKEISLMAIHVRMFPKGRNRLLPGSGPARRILARRKQPAIVK